MAEDIQGQLYKQLSEKYDFGDETAFRNALRSKEGAKYIYDTATQGGYDLGDYDTFESSMGVGQPVVDKVQQPPQEQPVTQPQPVRQQVEQAPQPTSPQPMRMDEAVSLEEFSKDLREANASTQSKLTGADVEDTEGNIYRTENGIHAVYGKDGTRTTYADGKLTTYTDADGNKFYYDGDGKVIPEKTEYRIDREVSRPKPVINTGNVLASGLAAEVSPWNADGAVKEAYLSGRSRALSPSRDYNGMSDSELQQEARRISSDPSVSAEQKARDLSDIGLELTAHNIGFRSTADMNNAPGLRDLLTVGAALANRHETVYSNELKNAIATRQVGELVDPFVALGIDSAVRDAVGQDYLDGNNTSVYRRINDALPQSFWNAYNDWAVLYAAKNNISYNEAYKRGLDNFVDGIVSSRQALDEEHEKNMQMYGEGLVENHPFLYTMLSGWDKSMVGGLVNGVTDWVTGSDSNTLHSIVDQADAYATKYYPLSLGMAPHGVGLTVDYGAGAFKAMGALAGGATKLVVGEAYMASNLGRVTASTINLGLFGVGGLAASDISRHQFSGFGAYGETGLRSILSGAILGKVNNATMGFNPVVRFSAEAGAFMLPSIGEGIAKGEIKELKDFGKEAMHSVFTLAVLKAQGLAEVKGSKAKPNNIESLERAGYGKLAEFVKENNERISRGDLPLGLYGDVATEYSRLQQDLITGKADVTWGDVTALNASFGASTEIPRTSTARIIERGGKQVVQTVDRSGNIIAQKEYKKLSDAEKKRDELLKGIERETELENVSDYMSARVVDFVERTARAIAEERGDGGTPTQLPDGSPNPEYYCATPESVWGEYCRAVETPEQKRTESQRRIIEEFNNKYNEIYDESTSVESVIAKLCEQFGCTDKEFTKEWNEDPADRSTTSAAGKAVAVYNEILSRGYNSGNGKVVGTAELEGGRKIETTSVLAVDEMGNPTERNTVVYYKDEDGSIQMVDVSKVKKWQPVVDPSEERFSLSSENSARRAQEAYDKLLNQYRENDLESLEKSEAEILEEINKAKESGDLFKIDGLKNCLFACREAINEKYLKVDEQEPLSPEAVDVENTELVTGTPEEAAPIEIDAEGNVIEEEQPSDNTNAVQAFAEGYFGERIPEGWVKTMVDNPAEFNRFVNEVSRAAELSPDSDAARAMEAYRKATENTPVVEENPIVEEAAPIQINDEGEVVETEQPTEAPKPENKMQPVEVEEKADNSERIEKVLDNMGLTGKDRDETRDNLLADEQLLADMEQQFAEPVKEEPAPENPEPPKVEEPKVVDNLDEPMPMLEDGEPNVDLATPKRTRKYLYEESGLEAQDANDKVDYEIKKAKEAVKKAEKGQPKMGDKGIDGNIGKFKKAQQEWNERKSEADAKLEYWNEVKRQQGLYDLITEIGETKAPKSMADLVVKLKGRFKDDREILNALNANDIEPRDLHEACMLYLSSGARFLWDGEGAKKGLKQELGWGEGERKKMYGMLSKDGTTIQGAVHDIVDQYGAYLGIDLSRSQDVYNALIEALGSVSTRGDVFAFVNSRRLQAVEDIFRKRLGNGEAQSREDAEADARANEEYNAFVEQYRDELPENFTQDDVYKLMEQKRQEQETPPVEEKQTDEEIHDDFFEQKEDEYVPFQKGEIAKPEQPINKQQRDYTARTIKKLRKAGVKVKLATQAEAQRVREIAEKVGAQLQAVFHGSASDFNAFDHSHMGEGEGYQAFGYGTYVTGVEGIAKHYATQSAMNKRFSKTPGYGNYDHYWKGQKIDLSTINPLRMAYDIVQREGTIKKAIAQVEKFIDNPEAHEGWGEALEILRQSRKSDFTRKRANYEGERFLYEVEIPKNNGTNYLKWDVPMSREEKSKIVDALYEKILAEDKEGLYDSEASRKGLADDLRSAFGSDGLRGSEVYGDVAAFLGGQEGASKFLHDLGYVGMEYPAQFMSGGRKDGAKNYVIFNEADAKITNKTEFLATSDGTIYGWHDADGIHLTERGFNPDTPAHEYAHGFMRMLKESDPKRYNKIVEGIRDSEVWKEVLNDPEYAKIKEDIDAVASETVSRLSGRENASRANTEFDKENIFSHANAVAVKERVKNALKDFWAWVSTKFGAKYSPEKVARITMRELNKGTNPDAVLEGLDVELMTVDTKSEAYKKKVSDAAERVEKRLTELNRLKKEQTLISDNENLASIRVQEKEPTSPPEGGDSGAVPDAKVNKKLQDANKLAIKTTDFIDKLSNGNDIDVSNFAKELVKTLEVPELKSDSQYAHAIYQDGDRVTLRISDHHGSARNIIINGVRTDRGVSIVLLTGNSPDSEFEATTWAKVDEYIYENPDKQRLIDISKSIFGLFDSGEYVDLAKANDVLTSPKGKTIEFQITNEGSPSQEGRTVEDVNRDLRDVYRRISSEGYDAVRDDISRLRAEREAIIRGEQRVESEESNENVEQPTPPAENGGEPPVEPPTPPAAPTPEPEPQLPPTAFDRPMTPIEMAKEAAIKAVADTKASLEQRNAARRELGRSLYDLHNQIKDLAGYGDKVDAVKAELQDLKSRYGTMPRDEYRQRKAEIEKKLNRLFKGKRFWKGLGEVGDEIEENGNFWISNTLRQVETAQRAYDRATVENVVSLAKMMVQEGLIDRSYISNLTPLFTKLKDATGKQDLTSTVNGIMDVMLKSQERSIRNELAKLMKITGTKVDENGVVKQAGLDIRGQHTMSEFKEYMDKGSQIIDRRIERLEEMRERVGEDDTERLDEIDDKILGCQLAKQYSEIEETHSVNISEAEEDLNYLKQRYKAGEMGVKEYTEQKHSLENLIRSYRMAQADALWNQINAINWVITDSKAESRNWVARQKERQNEIRHDAYRDMQGTPSYTQGDNTKMQEIANSALPKFFSSSLFTLQTMLKSLGNKHAMGEGYLYNRFFRGWMENRDAEITEYRDDMKTLNAKAKELTGKTYFGIYNMIKDLPTMSVEYYDGGEMRPHELDQGQLGYAYMVNKMEDGAAALRNMGITEEKMQEIAAFLNPKLKQFYDWLQDDFLAGKWDGMNEVHKRLFGADMDRVENYIPLRRDKEAGKQKVDISQENEQQLQSTVVGSIIKRVHSNLGIDLKHNNAIDVVANHLLEATHWKHFSEWKRDSNALLSDTKFRNKVKNSTTIYGSGDILWERLNQVFKIAGGDYKPSAKSSSIDKAIVDMARTVNTAKVSMRVFTATKQLLSLPVFATECNTATLLKNVGFLLSPDKVSGSPTQNSFVWCMENLPQFRERWVSRIAGETRLENGDLGWGYSRQKVLEAAGRIGLTPNAFIDACTVAAGAKSIYEKRYKQYRKDGFDEYKADKKAKIDAEVAFNESQQSSEKAFVSPLQVDRTAVALGLSTFRNASMGYERKFVDAVRNFKHLTMGGKEYKEILVNRKEKELIAQGMGKAEARAAAEKEYKNMLGAKAYREVTMEFMKKQMVNDGLTETQAKDAAERLYRRALWRSTLNFLMFGFGAQMAWNVGGKLPYLIFGDDDEEKKEIVEQAAVHAGIGGWVEGLPAGDMLSEGMTNWAMNLIESGNPLDGKSFFEFDPDLLTVTSDAVKVTKYLEGKNPLKGATAFVNLLGQIYTGVNPETFTDAGVAIYDACGGDPKVGNEALMCILRIMQCPQSQLDQMYIDELKMSAREAQKLSPEDVARRYAYYKAYKDTPYMWWMYNQGKKDEIVKKYEGDFTKKLNEDVKEAGGLPEDYFDLMGSATTKKRHDDLKNKGIDALAEQGPEALMNAYEKERAKGAAADYNVMNSIMSRYQKIVYGEEKMPDPSEVAYEAKHDVDLGKQAEKIGRDLGFGAQDSYFQMSKYKTDHSSKKDPVMKEFNGNDGGFKYSKKGKFFNMEDYTYKVPVKDVAKRAKALKVIEEHPEELRRSYRNGWRIQRIKALYEDIEAESLKANRDSKAMQKNFEEILHILDDERKDAEQWEKKK